MFANPLRSLSSILSRIPALLDSFPPCTFLVSLVWEFTTLLGACVCIGVHPTACVLLVCPQAPARLLVLRWTQEFSEFGEIFTSGGHICGRVSYERFKDIFSDFVKRAPEGFSDGMESIIPILGREHFPHGCIHHIHIKGGRHGVLQPGGGTGCRCWFWQSDAGSDAHHYQWAFLAIDSPGFLHCHAGGIVHGEGAVYVSQLRACTHHRRVLVLLRGRMGRRVGLAVGRSLGRCLFLAGPILFFQFLFILQVFVHDSTAHVSSHFGFFHVPRRSGGGAHGLQQGHVPVFRQEAPSIHPPSPLFSALLLGGLGIAHGDDAGRMPGHQARGDAHVRASDVHGTIQECLVGLVPAQQASDCGFEPLGCASARSMPHPEGVPCVFAKHLGAGFSEVGVELLRLHACTHRQGQQSTGRVSHHHVEEIPQRTSTCTGELLQHLHRHQSSYASAVQGEHPYGGFHVSCSTLPSQPGQDLGGGTGAPSVPFQVGSTRGTHLRGRGGLVGVQLHVHLAWFLHLRHVRQGLVVRHRIRGDGQDGVVVGIGTEVLHVTTWPHEHHGVCATRLGHADQSRRTQRHGDERAQVRTLQEHHRCEHVHVVEPHRRGGGAKLLLPLVERAFAPAHASRSACTSAHGRQARGQRVQMQDVAFVGAGICRRDRERHPGAAIIVVGQATDRFRPHVAGPLHVDLFLVAERADASLAHLVRVLGLCVGRGIFPGHGVQERAQDGIGSVPTHHLGQKESVLRRHQSTQDGPSTGETASRWTLVFTALFDVAQVLMEQVREVLDGTGHHQLRRHVGCGPREHQGGKGVLDLVAIRMHPILAMRHAPERHGPIQHHAGQADEVDARFSHPSIQDEIHHASIQTCVLLQGLPSWPCRCHAIVQQNRNGHHRLHFHGLRLSWLSTGIARFFHVQGASTHDVRLVVAFASASFFRNLHQPCGLLEGRVSALELGDGDPGLPAIPTSVHHQWTPAHPVVGQGQLHFRRRFLLEAQSVPTNASRQAHEGHGITSIEWCVKKGGIAVHRGPTLLRQSQRHQKVGKCSAISLVIELERPLRRDDEHKLSVGIPAQEAVRSQLPLSRDRGHEEFRTERKVASRAEGVERAIVHDLQIETIQDQDVQTTLSCKIGPFFQRPITHFERAAIVKTGTRTFPNVRAQVAQTERARGRGTVVSASTRLQHDEAHLELDRTALPFDPRRSVLLGQHSNAVKSVGFQDELGFSGSRLVFGAPMSGHEFVAEVLLLLVDPDLGVPISVEEILGPFEPHLVGVDPSVSQGVDDADDCLVHASLVVLAGQNQLVHVAWKVPVHFPFDRSLFLACGVHLAGEDLHLLPTPGTSPLSAYQGRTRRTHPPRAPFQRHSIPTFYGHRPAPPRHARFLFVRGRFACDVSIRVVHPTIGDASPRPGSFEPETPSFQTRMGTGSIPKRTRVPSGNPPPPPVKEFLLSRGEGREGERMNDRIVRTVSLSSASRRSCTSEEQVSSDRQRASIALDFRHRSSTATRGLADSDRSTSFATFLQLDPCRFRRRTIPYERTR
eukprot:scaffold110_cov315-Pavlova_lutheri.AAC.56